MAAATCVTVTATAAYASAAHTAGGDRSRPAAAQSRSEPSAVWPKKVPDRGLVKGKRLPLETYMLSSPDIADIEDARSAVESACMKEHGLTFNPPSARSTVPVGFNAANMERRYGLTDPDAARTHGYQLPSELTPEQEQEEADAEEKAEGRTEVWDDMLAGACIPEANQKIGIINPTDPVGDLSAQSFEATKNQATVAKTITAWSACMNDHGHKARSPLDAAGAFPQARSATPARAEVAAAVADVGCKKSTQLVDIWYKAEVAYQKKQIASHKKELEAAKVRNTKLIGNARAVLARTSNR
ncbi:hypothetical protein [Streptomyces sp. NPDC058249]|uniref:hypothetical protein n=1 Tax=Streptomyces sp. NPDC058249 TaxID=3346403 RepID=UPI0036E72997